MPFFVNVSFYLEECMSFKNLGSEYLYISCENIRFGEKTGKALAYAKDSDVKYILDNYEKEYDGKFCRALITGEVPGIKFGQIMDHTIELKKSEWSKVLTKMITCHDFLRIPLVMDIPEGIEVDNEVIWKALQEMVESKRESHEASMDANWKEAETREIEMEAIMQKRKEEKALAEQELLKNGVIIWDITQRSGYGQHLLYAWNPAVEGSKATLEKRITKSWYCTSREMTSFYSLSLDTAIAAQVEELQKKGWRFWYTDDYTD